MRVMSGWSIVQGPARKLTSSPGEEQYPRFSPDGSEIAYSARYNGNLDVFVVPVEGGLPTRVTYDSHDDRMVDWHPDGERLLFASSRASGSQRFKRFFLADKRGGMPEMLAIPYGEMGSFSPDGKRLAYVTRLAEDRPFKRYRGGFSSDVYIYDLDADTATKVTDSFAIDAKPIWSGDTIYFLSDADANLRLNVWAHDTVTGDTRQITTFEDFDVSYLGGDGASLVFDAENALYVMDVDALEPREVPVSIVSDLPSEIPRLVDVHEDIAYAAASPGGQRIVFQARGELFDVPKQHGFSVNLTRSSGAFDHSPAWSPDGSTVAYWSDRSGEFEIHLQAPGADGEARQLTDRGEGFGYRLHFSPDGSRIAFLDERRIINVVEVDSGRRREVTEVGFYGLALTHGARNGYGLAWSPDSRWLAFSRGKKNGRGGMSVYDVERDRVTDLTSGYYDDRQPAFSADGRYLFFQSVRQLDAVYSDLDATWIYPNATQLVALSLTADAPSPVAPRNDALEEDAPDASEEADEEEEVRVEIDFDDIEARLTVLPPRAGNFGALHAFPGKVVYVREPNSGSAERQGDLVLYDLEEREEEVILSGVAEAYPTADGEALLVRVKQNWGIVSPEPGQSIDEPVPVDGLVMNLAPREEWAQIYRDTWRRYRDFFYDETMHGLDWDAVGEQYAALLPDVRTRYDLARLQFHLLGETSAGHTYVRAGTPEPTEDRETGIPRHRLVARAWPLPHCADRASVALGDGGAFTLRSSGRGRARGRRDPCRQRRAPRYVAGAAGGLRRSLRQGRLAPGEPRRGRGRGARRRRAGADAGRGRPASQSSRGSRAIVSVSRNCRTAASATCT